MATYLIDYENVNKDGLNGVSKLTEKDRVIIFYSARADRMTFGLHRRLNETKALIEYRRVDVGGHNALDFQLATYLGFLLSENSAEEYCIVSNDRGFEYLAGFWREPRYHVVRTREIAASPQAEERRQQKNQERQNRLKTVNELPVSGEEALSDRTAAGSPAAEHDSFPEAEERTELIVLERNPDSEITVSDTAPVSAEEPTGSDHCAEENDGPENSMEAVPVISEEDSFRKEETAETVSETAASGNPEYSENGSAFPAVQDSQYSGVSGKTDTGKETDLSEEQTADASDETIPEGTLQELRDDPENQTDGTETDRTQAAVRRNIVSEDRSSGFSRDYNGKRLSSRERYQNSRKKTTFKNRGENADRRFAAPNTAESREESLRRKTERCLTGVNLTEEDLKEITAYIGHYKTKLGINNALVRRFGTQKAGEIYKMIKSLIGDKKGSIEKNSISPEEEKILKDVEAYVRDLGLTEEERREIASYVQKYKTRQGFNNALVRHFGSQKAGTVYKLVKPLLSGKKDKAGSAGRKKASPEEERIETEVRKLVSGIDLTEEDVKEISSSVFRYKTRQGVNNALVRRFRSQKAGEIYKTIKPLLREKKGSRNE